MAPPLVADGFDCRDAVAADLAVSAGHPAAAALAGYRLAVAVWPAAASVGFVRHLAAVVLAVEPPEPFAALADSGSRRLVAVFAVFAVVVWVGFAAAVAYLVCRKPVAAVYCHHPIFSFCLIFPTLSG